MGLTKYKLGELIHLCDDRNSDNKYTLDNVRGISIQKIFIDTKADMSGVSLKPYILVKPDYFAYVTVTSRNGGKITIAHNATDNTYIVSSSYVVFDIKRLDLLLSDYLFMYFNRPEFDRYARFNSWGSARETFSWEDMCDIDIELPSIEIQQKYVDIYNAMLANQQSYERGLEDLKLVCDGYIENLRRKYPQKRLKEYLVEKTGKNKNDDIKQLFGLDRERGFVEPGTMSSNVDIKGYKCVVFNDIVYPPPHFGNIGTIGIFKSDKGVVSPMYVVFSTRDDNILNSNYLMLWLNRQEFKRYAFFSACDSIRDTFDFAKLCEYSIPIPPIEVQKSIANIYKAYIERKGINERLKAQIKDICPILIKGSLDEAKKEVTAV